MRKITFRKLRKSKRQVPLPQLPRRARVAEPWTNWQNDSGTFTTSPVHWPVVCMFHNLLGEASGDLERVTPRSRESLCTETMQNKRRCSRSETPTFKPCSRSETSSAKPCSRAETLSGKLRFRSEMPSEKSVSRTSTDTPMPQSSAESMEQVVEGDFRKQLE